MNNSFNLKNLSLVAIATASLALGALQPVNAAEQEDGRVRAALEKAGVEFTVTDDKTFKVIVKLKGGRTQVVLIDSNTSKIKGTNMEFREVYALAHKVEDNLPADLSNKMMKQSHDKKIGAWELIQGNGTSLAIFTAKVDAGLNDTNIVKIINSVGLVADTMEEEISGKDEY
jgi:opacity protein-like surface antigen